MISWGPKLAAEISRLKSSKHIGRHRAAVLSIIAGFVAVGLFCVFLIGDYADRYVGTVSGVVSAVWRERGGYVMCQVMLDDGALVIEECGNLRQGHRVTADKYQRRLTRRYDYRISR